VNYGAAVHADKWIPIRPNTDAALQLVIAYLGFKDGTYDKKYLETHAYGVDKFEAYVMGEEDGCCPKSAMPKPPVRPTRRSWRWRSASAIRWARPRCRRAAPVLPKSSPVPLFRASRS
jgi:hypothetical protein